jgi:MtfA peptidase
LLNNYQFYRRLPEYSKNKFDERLSNFISSRDFTGRDIEVEPHMKIMIGAAAVKFSLGLNRYNLSGFKRIVVFPEEYYSKITGQYHKGEANGMGIIAFSWKHFQEGLDSPNDNLNLGVHEFAHAYFLQQTHMSGESPFDDANFSQLRQYLQRSNVINDVKNRELFRNYAFRNEMEFFAILGEHFFETPSTFKQEAPRLYNMYGRVLKQDTVLLGM